MGIPVVKWMLWRTPGTLLRYLHILNGENFPVGTGIQTAPLPCIFGGIDDHRSIRPLVDGITLAGRDTGSFITMLTHMIHIGHLCLGHLTPDILLHRGPELAGTYIHYKDFHLHSSFHPGVKS